MAASFAAPAELLAELAPVMACCCGGGMDVGAPAAEVDDGPAARGRNWNCEFEAIAAFLQNAKTEKSKSRKINFKFRK